MARVRRVSRLRADVSPSVKRKRRRLRGWRRRGTRLAAKETQEERERGRGFGEHLPSRLISNQ